MEQGIRRMSSELLQPDLDERSKVVYCLTEIGNHLRTLQ
jgi:hypothetical protein